MHKLCETMDGLLFEYASFIGSLELAYRHSEGESLSLNSLQVQIEPTLHIYIVLEQAVDAVRCLKRGALLNALRNLKLRAYQGDGLASRVLQLLLEAAATPYLKMLA